MLLGACEFYGLIGCTKGQKRNQDNTDQEMGGRQVCRDGGRLLAWEGHSPGGAGLDVSVRGFCGRGGKEQRRNVTSPSRAQARQAGPWVPDAAGSRPHRNTARLAADLTARTRRAAPGTRPLCVRASRGGFLVCEMGVSIGRCRSLPSGLGWRRKAKLPKAPEERCLRVDSGIFTGSVLRAVDGAWRGRRSRRNFLTGRCFLTGEEERASPRGEQPANSWLAELCTFSPGAGCTGGRYWDAAKGLGCELKGHGYLNWLSGIPGWWCSSAFTLAKGNWSQALSRAQQMNLGPQRLFLADVDLTLIFAFCWTGALGHFLKSVFLVIV